MDPLRTVVFDRFFSARTLGGPSRPGLPRELWADKVLPLALRGLVQTGGMNKRVPTGEKLSKHPSCFGSK
eukprot:1804931-Alexandrium_andersonii.AAC.1